MAPGAIEATSMADNQQAIAPQTPLPEQLSRTQPEHEEYQYLDLIRSILDQGEHRPDRTGTGTYSIFAPRQLRFTLSSPNTNTTVNSPSTPTLILPLLTTKRVFLRAVVAELLWFVAGSTSSLPLSDAGIHIWDGNGSRSYLDSVGLSHRAEGDLGPVYGFQWRHFGAEYVDAETDYTGKGVDQLAEVVRKLRDSPYDRRIILSAWNPADLGKMALPPCHMFAQFYVSFPSARRRAGGSGGKQRGNTDNDTDAAEKETAPETTLAKAKEQGTLHAILYQRSCDMGLGVPFNIASYALLTHMLAHAAGLIPGSLTHTMGDAHVYLDHVEALEGQLAREPRDFPTLEIRREGGCGVDGWSVEDFVVKGYAPHKAVAMKMSV